MSDQKLAQATPTEPDKSPTPDPATDSPVASAVGADAAAPTGGEPNLEAVSPSDATPTEGDETAENPGAAQTADSPEAVEAIEAIEIIEAVEAVEIIEAVEAIEVAADHDTLTPEATAEQLTTEAKGTTAVSSAEPDDSAVAAGDTEPAPKPPAQVLAEPVDPEVAAVIQARKDHSTVVGRVFGWNDHGFHVVLGELSAFCPGSEMEIGAAAEGSAYLDKEFAFKVLKVQQKGRRIVVSRAAVLREELGIKAQRTVSELEVGAVLTGTISSITDFGAFVDLGGTEGLVHISELSRRRVQKASEVVEIGQQVEVKVLKIEQKGRRISLSMKALQPDPWADVKKLYPEGRPVTGKVESTAVFGAFIQLQPGLTGLLPTPEMKLPPGSSPGKAFPVGREVTVQVAQIDVKRRRISLVLPGSQLEGSRTDYLDYVRRQEQGVGLSALAAAFERLDDKPEAQ